MSRLGPIALLVFLSSTAAASACCLFKCCNKSAVYDGPSISPGETGVRSASKQYLKITFVGGFKPDSTNNVVQDIPTTQDLEVIVESNFDPSTSNPELNLADDGPFPVAAAVTATAGKKYKPKKIIGPKALTAGSTSPPTPPPAATWQTIYEIPKADLSAGRRYSLQATAGTIGSNRVTFHTPP